MKKLLVIWLALISCLPAARAQTAAATQAQRDSLCWEQVLEAYQSFCDMAADARGGDSQARRSLQGAADRITALLGKVRGSRMTPSQQRRFDRMKMRYSSVVTLPDPGSAMESLSVTPVQVIQGKTVVIRDTVVVMREVRQTDTVRIVEQVEVPVEIPVERVVEVPAAEPAPVSAVVRPAYIVLAQAMVPDVSGGILLGVTQRNWGMYLRFDSNFQRRTADYSVSANGQAPYGPIWTSGRSSVARFSVTGGLLLHPLPWLSAYAGAGYGRRRLCWEDSAGRWAEVTDVSHRGLAVDAGAVFFLDRFALSAGVSSIGFSRFDAALGIGFVF